MIDLILIEMMTTKHIFIIGVAVFLGIFLYYPPPNLTLNLKKWMDSGHYFQFKDHKIFYIDKRGQGDKGTLVCLHGFPSSSYDWKKIMPGLQKKFKRLILLDFLGFGFSDKPVNHYYKISEQADLTVALLKYLQETDVHILSHDYGDTVALELLARYNDGGNVGESINLNSLSMLNGGIFVETHYPRFVQKLLLIPVIGPIAARLSFYKVFERGFLEVFGNNKPTEDELWEFWAIIRYNDGNIAWSRIIEFLVERRKFSNRWVGALKNTKLKVQMIYGPADPVNPPEFGKFFRKSVPQHELVDLDAHVGHYPQWEHPEAVLTSYYLFVDEITQKDFNNS